MVIKTELCAYSQWKIYPGHGQRFVDKDGKSSLFLYKRSRIFALRYSTNNLEKLKHKN
jgi:large subunit ribosomal protein L24e